MPAAPAGLLDRPQPDTPTIELDLALLPRGGQHDGALEGLVIGQGFLPVSPWVLRDGDALKSLRLRRFEGHPSGVPVVGGLIQRDWSGT